MFKKIYGLRTVFSNTLIQRLLLLILVGVTFWNGLWGGAPRADQVLYLHQVSQYSNIWDILINSPSWNRIQSGGDFMLFRPILYLQLGSFYYFFGYNFFYWQLASLILHILVVLGLYSLLLQGRLRNTAYPLVISAFFGCSFISSELVLWSHISGYITFSLFVIYAVLLIVKFISTDKISIGYISLIFGIFAEFTYELGVVLNILIAIALFYNHRLKASSNKDYLTLTLLFIGSAILYPVFSVSDLIFRNMHISFDGSKVSLIQGLALAVRYTVKQIVFWIGGWVLPSGYKIVTSSRMSFSEFNFTSVYFLINSALAFGVVYISILGLVRDNGIFNRKPQWLSALCALIFLLLYSFVIAYGRSLPRGIETVLYANLYYAYIACLSVAVGFALFFVKNKANYTGHVNNKINFARLGNMNILSILLVALVAFNVYFTYQISSAYRYDFSPSRFEVISAIQYWIDNSKKTENSYFVVNEACLGNDKLPWGKNNSRKFPGTIALADLLFPEKSFDLNRDNLSGKAYDVSEIKCAKI